MKASTIKQIKNKLITVNVLKNSFAKTILSIYGEEDGITITQESVGEGNDCSVYIIKDEKENEEVKSFRLVVKEYEKKNKIMIKVVKILDL